LESEKMTKSDLHDLDQHFAAAAKQQWTAKEDYGRVMQRIRGIEDTERKGTNREARGTSLVVLDTEFSITSQQVMEVAAVERISGKRVINTLLKHEKGTCHYSSARETSTTEHVRSRIHAAGVYAPGRTIERMDVHQFAASILQSGITTDTIILVWHN
jgi:hypothetical protein